MTEHAYSDEERAARLRSASDDFMQRLDRLFELETRKRELPPERPEFIRLAREIEDMSQALLSTSGRQVDLAEEVHADVRMGDADANVPIRDAPPKREAVHVLAEWRAAERRLAAAGPGSRDEVESRADIERLRAEYRDITAPAPDPDQS